MTYSYLKNLVCPRCGRARAAEGIVSVCECGSPLFCEYDIQGIADNVTKEQLAARPQTLWRYHEWLPVQAQRHIVSLHEPFTPILPLARTGRDMGLERLLVKDEGVLPSGTFKARGAAVGVSRARELGVEALAIPTNGNAGAAWALYAACAGMRCTVVAPTSAPLVPRKECVIAGADLYVVDGTIGDAGVIVARGAKRHGWYDVATLKEPYRLEGKKTIGLEIADQFGWSVPDVIVYPTGGGAGVIGIVKGMRELHRMGWIGPKLPRMALVQAAGCAPLVEAYERGDDVSQEWEDPYTIAFGMRVPKALADFMLLDIVRDTDGTAIAVTDEEIAAERSSVVAREGLHVCPEGAAALAGTRKLRASGWLRADETVLVINTGSGLKYADQIPGEGKLLQLGAVL